MIGTSLDHYRITGKLGAGGMGEVWRAEDTRLGREVALKVLPAEFAEDGERLAYFEREARVLASLNHPNIATLFGLETVSSQSAAESSESGAGSIPSPDAPGPSTPQAPKPSGPQALTTSSPLTFLVMELVEGEDLSDRIAKGPIPVDEAIPIALQIAEALEAAHETGIVHRDLKPANIKITGDGTVKVLDFGLAKAWESNVDDADLSLSPTLTARATAIGVILGTAAYMSPEQARGKPVDRRADIWAFGVLLWEMLTGRRLFTGDTVSDVLASVLKEPPDLSALPPATPEALRRLVGRCLQKDQRQRLQWIGDARLELNQAAVEPTAVAAPGSPIARPGSGRRELAAWTIAVVACAVGLWAWLAPERGADPEQVRFAVTLDEGHRLSFVDLPMIDLSPDGRTVAFVATDLEHGRQTIFLRQFRDDRVRLLAGTEGASHPFFSPDGREIAFFADGELKKVPTAGGTTVSLVDAPTPRGAVWLPDGTIVYSPEYSAGLMTIDAGGGSAQPLIELDVEAEERTFRFPDVIPGGDAILFTVGTMDSPNNYDDARIDVWSPGSGDRKTILERANMARWVDDRTLVYSRAGVLYAVAFDPDELEVVGEAVPVIDDVGGDPSSGAGYFAVAENGTCVWVRGAVTETDSMITVVGRDGQEAHLPLAPRGFYQPRFSPGGDRLALTIGEGRSGVEGDIWVYSFESQTLSRLTFDSNGLYPVWTRDGSRIGFLSYLVQPTIMTVPADGRGGLETFCEGDLSPIFPESYSADGGTLAYTQVGQSSDIFLVGPDGEARLFESHASSPVFSPDGRWIAYASPGSGSSSVYVRPVLGEGKWQVSPELGGYPRWSGDGRRLFYIDIGSAKRPLMEVEVGDGEAFRAGPPKVVVPDLGGRFVTTTAPANNWDAAPDGDHFVFVEFERDERSRGRIEVELNWAERLDVGRG